MRLNTSSIVEAVLELEPPPCEGGCNQRDLCARYSMACEQFAVYAGSVKRKKRLDSEISKRPTRAIFNCIFPPNGSYKTVSGPLRKALAAVR